MAPTNYFSLQAKCPHHSPLSVPLSFNYLINYKKCSCRLYNMQFGSAYPCASAVHMEPFSSSAFKVSFEYLLLPPRSAPTAAPPRLAPRVLQRRSQRELMTRAY